MPHLKDPLKALVCVTVCNFHLTCLPLRLSIPCQAARGVYLKTTTAQHVEEDKILKCLRIVDDIQWRAGLFVITSGMRLG